MGFVRVGLSKCLSEAIGGLEISDSVSQTPRSLYVYVKYEVTMLDFFVQLILFSDRISVLLFLRLIVDFLIVPLLIT